MPGTITPDLLRTLAGFRAREGCAISLYVNLDPSVAPTQPDVSARISSLLAEAGRQVDGLRESLPREKREGLKRDIGRIERWLTDGLDRNGSHGAVVFADEPDGFWSAHTVVDPVQEEVRIGEELHLAPLLPVIADGGALVAYVGRERAQVYELRAGRLVEVADRTGDVPGRHDQGGWAQGRFGRHIENIVGRHLRRVAATLDAAVRRAPAAAVVLVGSEEIQAELDALLTTEVKTRLAGWASAERHASAGELLAAAEPVLASARTARETELLERWREAAAKEGRASAGWAETLTAASDGRVELLLVQQGTGRAAYRCPVCGRAQTVNGACPLDGAAMEAHPDGLDLAVHQTLAHGGAIDMIRSHRDLDPVEGIGALLRY